MTRRQRRRALAVAAAIDAYTAELVHQVHTAGDWPEWVALHPATSWAEQAALDGFIVDLQRELPRLRIKIAHPNQPGALPAPPVRSPT